MERLAKEAIERGLALGATYVDARVERIASETLVVRNERLSEASSREEFGLAVRALVDGAFGFAAAPLARGDASTARALAERAVALGRKLAPARTSKVELSPEPPAVGEFKTPFAIDPFALRDAEKLGPLRAAVAALGGRSEVSIREATFGARSRISWFASSEGAAFHQELLRTGAGIAATATASGEVVTRSWPASLGGDYQPGGFERVAEFELLAHAPRVRDEAIELCSAPTCEPGRHDLVLASNLLMLVIHESVGHATELDRALGCETDLAGHSFATPDRRGTLLFGSPWVELVADSTAVGGLDTRGIDDEGVRSQRWPLIHAGRLVDFQSSREWASALGASSSRGNARAQSWYHPPIVRITNVCLEPGSWDLEALVADTGDGILCDGVKMWSIDEQRRNFQFTAELGVEIRGGKRGRLVRAPTFTGDTLEFWRSCDAVCGPLHFRWWGITNCGKGNPMQEAEMSHGAAPARFRRVRFLAG
ncbi:MAG: TldD/PmbA family protein [Planctomycetes bacterium]|nr:TldD/PmbA family protein [Planctomycetota bacterium]